MPSHFVSSKFFSSSSSPFREDAGYQFLTPFSHHFFVILFFDEGLVYHPDHDIATENAFRRNQQQCYKTFSFANDAGAE
jgi:hypothetical protein